MGLGVMGYKNLKLVTEDLGDDFDEDEYVRFFDHPSFPGRYDGLVKGAYYTGEYLDGPDFSYAGYTMWREQLAKLAGYEQQPVETYPGHVTVNYCGPCWNGATGPFSEQINFSDCEGTIGPVVAKKLGQDYIDFKDRAEAIGGWFYDQYLRFMDVFDPTLENNAVEFS